MMKPAIIGIAALLASCSSEKPHQRLDAIPNQIYASSIHVPYERPPEEEYRLSSSPSHCM